MAGSLSSLTNAVLGFRFVVLVNKIPFGVFTECTLPTIEWETEEVKEGGLNTYTHQLPGRRKQARVTLSNGVGASLFMEWYMKSMEEVVERRSVTITLLNSMRQPAMVWHINDAYPVKWQGPQLKSGDNSVAVQSLELACGDISVVPSGGAI